MNYDWGGGDSRFKCNEFCEISASLHQRGMCHSVWFSHKGET